MDYKSNIGDKNAAGNRIHIKGEMDGDNVITGYWHLKNVAINPSTGETYKQGDKVKAGDIIGYGGTTGSGAKPDSAGPHLHLMMKKDGKTVNPEDYLPTKFNADGKPKKNDDKED